jgi:regulator of protease activity HflC (stomatin/prohibitin superfamily)
VRLVSNSAQKCIEPKIIMVLGGPRSLGAATMNPITVFLTVACLVVGAGLGAAGHLYLGVPVAIVGIIIASALKMANTWQKFVILRAGKLRGVKGPGLFLIIPVIDHVVAVIDERIQTTAFSAEAALTKDTVPVK